MEADKQLNKFESTFQKVCNFSPLTTKHSTTPNISRTALSLVFSQAPSEGRWTWFLFLGSIRILVYSRSRFCSERLFEQRMWYHKQNKWDLNSMWPRKPFKTHISYIYFGAGVRWCGMGGSKGLWRNPLTKLLPRWEWKEPIIALWRIKTTSANSPNICVVPQNGSFTASGFPVQINSAEVYKGGLAPSS